MYNNLDWLIPKINAVKKEVTKLSNKFTQYQKKLTAGDNITIENNVISASGGGGGGGMLVKVTADEETFALSADKTFAEIQEAFRAGVNVVAKLYIGEEFGGTTSACISCGEQHARFGMVFLIEGSLNVKYELECDSEDGVDKWTSAAF